MLSLRNRASALRADGFHEMPLRFVLSECLEIRVVVVLIGPPKPRRLLGDSHNMHDSSRFFPSLMLTLASYGVCLHLHCLF